MKTIYTILLMMLVAIVPAYAQKQDKKSREEMRREIQEFKIRYLAQEMELTDEQKSKFEPLYNRMSTERWQLFQNARRLERKVKKDKNATEADYQAAAKAMTEAKEKDADLMKNYDAQFSKFLSSKQMFKMKESEQEFDKRMRKMRHDRKQMKQNKAEKR